MKLVYQQSEHFSSPFPILHSYNLMKADCLADWSPENECWWWPCRSCLWKDDFMTDCQNISHQSFFWRHFLRFSQRLFQYLYLYRMLCFGIWSPLVRIQNHTQLWNLDTSQIHWREIKNDKSKNVLDNVKSYEKG